MKAPADVESPEISMKWRTARIQARVIVSWYFEGSMPLCRRNASSAARMAARAVSASFSAR